MTYVETVAEAGQNYLGVSKASAFKLCLVVAGQVSLSHIMLMMALPCSQHALL